MASLRFRSIDRLIARARHVSPRVTLSTNRLNQAPHQNMFSKSFAHSAILYSNRTRECHNSNVPETKSASTSTSTSIPSSIPSLASTSFWGSLFVWKRAGVNTLRCLAGCSIGDFSSMWFLQAYYPDLGMGIIMATSISAGLATSMSLETVLLRLGRDGLSWEAAAKTAVGMSLVSMVGMETVQNIVDYHLTGGVVALDDSQFWYAAAISMLAGFLAPLPYNYTRLRKYGRACH